jgi:hypothetical protein
MTAALRRLPEESRVRLARVLGMLGSAFDGERSNAAAMADKMLRAAGLSWADLLAEQPPPPPPPAGDPWRSVQDWRDRASQILATGRVTAWERKFCEDLLDRWDGWDLTEKQERCLDKIFRERVGRART